jgi:hypothetical protein
MAKATQTPTGGSPPDYERTISDADTPGYVPTGLKLIAAHIFAHHGETMRE